MRLVLHWQAASAKKVAYGENSFRPYYNGCGYPIHAEMSSMLHLARSTITRNKYWERKKLYVNLYVIRINSFGGFCMSKPCSKCYAEMIRKSRIKIKYIIYSVDNGFVKVRFNKFASE